MYLKSVTLQGFKSFANRAELTFFPGITAVVGPNGSGKSNIADAIRWVLGEQSLRTLRGLHMQDVIFAGSDLRRPLGLAEVSLTLDNSARILPLDFAEVTVTRRVFRSGESEFFINRVPCRLRDIQSLLLDSGMGRGTFSIIGQGEVEAVLSASSEERRLLLEDAAGIARYRVRKEEALERLAETAENLLRVNDVIGEVAERLPPLQHAAELARRYEEMAKRQAELEITLFGHEWARLDRLRRAEAERRAAAAQAMEEVNTRLQGIEQEMLGQEQALDKAAAELELARNARQKVREAEQAAGHAAELGQQRLQQLKRDKERNEEQKARVAAQQGQWQGELAEAENRLAELTAAAGENELLVTRWQATAAEAETQLRTATAVQAELRAALLTAETAAARWEGEWQSSQSGNEAANDRRSRLASEKSNHLAKAAAAAAEHERLREQLAAKQAALQALRQEKAAGEEHLVAARRERERSEEQLAAHKQRYSEVASRGKVLAAMVESYDGYYQGPRNVLAFRRRLGADIVGSMGELIRVPAELEVAVEIALGSSLQNIVTRREADAAAAIAYLKQTRGGRATFLPLDALRYTPLSRPDQEMLKRSDAVGIASHLVSCAPEVQPAIEYLLGRTVIVRQLPAALQLAKTLGSFQRLVTLEGEIVTPGGAITGGSVANGRAAGILARQRELAELQEELTGLTAAGDRLAAAAAAASDTLRQAEARLQEIAESGRQLELELKGAERDLAAAAAACGELAAAGSRLAEEEAWLSEQDRSWAERAALAEKEVAATRERRLTADQQLQAASSQVDERGRQLAAAREELARLRSRQAEVAQTLTVVKKEIGRLQTLCAEGQKQGREAETQLAAALADEDNVARQLAQTQQEAAARHEELLAWEKKLEVARAAAEEHRQEVASGIEQERQARQAKDEALEKLHRADMALERLEVSITTVEEKLAERGAAPAAPAESFNAGAARREVEQLRKEIAELGPVNHGALAELTEVEERHRFLCAQRDDLTAAKISLEETIAEIDQTSARRLRAAYDAVRAAFRKVFRELFGGGEADLLWTDQAQLLEAGLDMMVQPPGKKLQSLMALSGGERALTAIAFLFGMVEAHSGPFCVLDEIDAALDEQNVSRFATMLARFAEKTQFIVITHRQPTMERADALYGVSMDRSAASTLVSLRLSGLEAAL